MALPSTNEEVSNPFLSEATISAAFSAQVTARPSAPALVFEDLEYTFAELDRAADRMSAWLQAEGVAAGDRIGWWGKNHADYVALLLACARTAAVLTVINWRLAPREVKQILADCDPVLVVASEELATELSQTGRRAFVSGELSVGGLTSIADAVSHYNTPTPTVIDRTSPFVQLYTSGTTGEPKGVPQSHANHLATYRAWSESGIGLWDGSDRCLVATPVFHAIATNFCLFSLTLGACVHLLREFSLEAATKALASGSITRIPLVPTIIDLLANDPVICAMDHARLRTLIYGGAAIPRSVLQRGLTIFRCDFTQVYAATETTAAGTNLAPADHLGDDPPLASCGRPQPGIELMIVDAEGATVSDGLVGEIAMRGESIMAGYWNRPNDTAKVLRDGWYYTGDAAFKDAAGLVYIVDRTRDMMISGGENVFPSEVELAIRQHSEIVDVAVFGVPDKRWGQVISAGVVMRENAPPVTIESLREFLIPLIARFKHPRNLLLLKALPRNASGKIMRDVLREKIRTTVKQ